jgi:hypothetical protein
MIDNINPNSSFHPHQPIDAVPHAEEPERGLAGVAEKVGMNPDKLRNFTERVRSMNGRIWWSAAGRSRRAVQASPSAVSPSPRSVPA